MDVALLPNDPQTTVLLVSASPIRKDDLRPGIPVAYEGTSSTPSYQASVADEATLPNSGRIANAYDTASGSTSRYAYTTGIKAGEVTEIVGWIDKETKMDAKGEKNDDQSAVRGILHLRLTF